jgi:hypothetical protein
MNGLPVGSIVVVLAAVAAYWFPIRRWFLRWGTTPTARLDFNRRPTEGRRTTDQERTKDQGPRTRDSATSN